MAENSTILDVNDRVVVVFTKRDLNALQSLLYGLSELSRSEVSKLAEHGQIEMSQAEAQALQTLWGRLIGLPNAEGFK